MEVPFIDLQAQYVSIKNEIDQAIASVISRGQFIGGQFCETFEETFKKLTGSQNCVGLGNGTDALFLSLKALGVGPGCEVLTPAFSWISTAEVISLVGATPVFVDVDVDTYTINPDLIEQKISKKAKAIILVHLFGSAGFVKDVKAICDKHNLHLIEDCAQAHLSEEAGKIVGTIGHAGSFSFYPTKNLGAYGDAGCVITPDIKLAEKIRRLANHGALKKDDHQLEGLNSRLDVMQAAILNVKSKHLKKWTEQRIRNADIYNKLLTDIEDIVLPLKRHDAKHTFHAYVIRVKRRDDLKVFLGTNGIQTVIHYPKALVNLSIYQQMGFRTDDFPVATKIQNEVLSLPIYPELSSDQIEYVCGMIKAFYKNKK